MSEILYNGIELPSPWPPRDRALTSEPLLPAPYLVSPPDVIPIDVGRQLFVDDFLIAETTLKRMCHLAEYYPENPVLKPDKPWESSRHPDLPKWREAWAAPTAMPFSDGVWYDPKDKLFKLWYMGGMINSVCYAISEDGIHWEKPLLDVELGTNVVYPNVRESSTVWLDLEEKDPSTRYKLFYHKWCRLGEELQICFSPDGIHWTEPIEGGINGDRTTVFYNPFRKVWVFSIRSGVMIEERGVRTRHYREHPEAIPGAQWKEGDPVAWVGADRLDLPRPGSDMNHAELYNLDCVAYESLMIGLFSILQGHQTGRPKINELKVGFSRDGFNWHRPDRRVFIPASETPYDWNWGNVQSAGGCCLVVGDRLYFYVSGRAGMPDSCESGVCSTGLAILRRDGFASMDAGANEGTLTTRTVRFNGKHLFVNTDCARGQLSGEILYKDGQVIPGFSRGKCVAVSADSTLAEVKWTGVEDLSAISGQHVKLRFHLSNGKLYSFWVSPDESGASHGYVAAGGPGFTGSRDTIGAEL